MLVNEVDSAYEKFLEIMDELESGLSETDTRVKIIDRIFKECLGWSDSDIRRETRVHKGFSDYIFSIDKLPVFVLEAKQINETFEVPRTFDQQVQILFS